MGITRPRPDGGVIMHAQEVAQEVLAPQEHASPHKK